MHQFYLIAANEHSHWMNVALTELHNHFAFCTYYLKKESYFPKAKRDLIHWIWKEFVSVHNYTTPVYHIQYPESLSHTNHCEIWVWVCKPISQLNLQNIPIWPAATLQLSGVGGGPTTTRPLSGYKTLFLYLVIFTHMPAYTPYV